jgi:hypothetical protein
VVAQAVAFRAQAVVVVLAVAVVQLVQEQHKQAALQHKATQAVLRLEILVLTLHLAVAVLAQSAQ